MPTESQFSPAIALRNGAARLIKPVELRAGSSAYDEKWLQHLLFAHPQAIPVGELDASYGPLVPICMELDTRGAGIVDALFANHLGLLTIAEFKLWRNPEARREVVGQILDYARVLRRWTYSDLQREVSRTLKRSAENVVYERVREHHPELDERTFTDNVARSLRNGRFLLVVIGDGIREGVEAIANYVQEHAGLHFTFGLVETAVYELEDGQRIVQPRILARSAILNRTVVELASDDMRIADAKEDAESEELSERDRFYLTFWEHLLAKLKLDDVEQPIPKPNRSGNLFFSLPSKATIWITVYFSQADREIGIFLGSSRTSKTAQDICETLTQEQETIGRELGIPVEWRKIAGKPSVIALQRFASLNGAENESEQIAWFADRINRFVNVFRPRVARLWQELGSEA